jgi:chromosome partitioning protein
MSNITSPYIFVVGNEKGGAGKTTCSMHLIASLLDSGLRVASMDTDSRQHSLTRYINNRKAFVERNPDVKIAVPLHFLIPTSAAQDVKTQEAEELKSFEGALNEASKDIDVIVIDTPGSYSFLSRLAHSYANTIITPINDSFLDIDVIAKINPDDLSIITPSIYSEMIWQQKMTKAKRDGTSIEWIVMRNRLSNLNAKNKNQISEVLKNLSKRISLKVAPGFSERVIFRELFLEGLTLLDLIKIPHIKKFTTSHLAARQELRDFMQFIDLDNIMKR